MSTHERRRKRGQGAGDQKTARIQSMEGPQSPRREKCGRDFSDRGMRGEGGGGRRGCVGGGRGGGGEGGGRRGGVGGGGGGGAREEA